MQCCYIAPYGATADLNECCFSAKVLTQYVNTKCVMYPQPCCKVIFLRCGLIYVCVMLQFDLAAHDAWSDSVWDETELLMYFV